jgi:hypothetical protein
MTAFLCRSVLPGVSRRYGAMLCPPLKQDQDHARAVAPSRCREMRYRIRYPPPRPPDPDKKFAHYAKMFAPTPIPIPST